MTRINCLNVSELNDKMLLGEYKELPRVSTLSWKWDNRIQEILLGGKVPQVTLPENYTLGTGHVKFFYDKGEFLRRRFEEEIVPEMQRRGFKTSFTKYRMHPVGLNNDWTPTEEAMRINRERIAERLAAIAKKKENK